VRVLRGIPAAASDHVALTIGNFDGVHRGHQAMLARLSEAAADLELPAAVLTFEPHPREFFTPGHAPPRLSSVRGKLEQFRAAGVDRVCIARFDASLAALSPEAFIERVLLQSLGVRWVLVGEDFRFGRGRKGDLATLRAQARSFSVEAMGTVMIEDERASSTAVRAALAAGDMDHAARLLGRPFAITGRVVHGAKRGAGLGFPTANIRVRQMPLSGIYAVRVRGLGEVALPGVASIGVRPTVEAEGEPLLEVFLFDFDRAIYGRRIEVEFLHKLRDEQRFDDMDALARQMRQDADQARAYLRALS
jgi:riboflavin kinase/FMN adenylyltransferase